MFQKYIAFASCSSCYSYTTSYVLLSNYYYCGECAINFLKNSHKHLNKTDFKRLLESDIPKTNPEIKELILELQKHNEIIHSNSLRYCPTCSQFTTFRYSENDFEIDDRNPITLINNIKLKNFVNGSQNKFTPIYCANCKNEFCYNCRKIHPDKLCSDLQYCNKQIWINLLAIANHLDLHYKVTCYLRRLIVKGEINCPRCSIVISKVSGCKHMLCCCSFFLISF